MAFEDSTEESIGIKSMRAMNGPVLTQELRSMGFDGDFQMIGQRRQRLKADLPKGLHGRWVVNYPEHRIGEFLKAGWRFLCVSDEVKVTAKNDDVGSVHMRIVGTKPDGSPKHQYLMVCPVEFAEEIKRKKKERLDEDESRLIINAINKQGGRPGEIKNAPQTGFNTSIKHSRLKAVEVGVEA